AHERAEVTGVIFGPQAWLVQRLGATFHRGPVESAHGTFVGGRKGDVVFSIGSHAGTGRAFRDPERRLAVTAVSDGPAEIQLP
ncbi:MAG TPA: hypothetical protein VGI23_02335, partial [Steroidobacteraceae bacterium]